MLISLLLLSAFWAGGMNSQSAPAAQGQEIPLDVSFCELANSPDRFSGKLIRVRALYGVGMPDTVVFYREECPGRIEPRIKCITDAQCDELKAGLLRATGPYEDELIGDLMRGWITATGRLEIHPRSEIYRHERGFVFQIQRVEKAEHIRDDLENGQSPKPRPNN